MSLADCLNVAVEAREITSQEAERLMREHERFRRGWHRAGSPFADKEATRSLQELLKAETAHKKQIAKLSIVTAKRMAADLDSWRNAKGERDVAGGSLDLLEHFGTASFESVEGRRKAIVGDAHAKMEAMLYQFRRGALGGDLTRKNKAQLPNLVREAFGVDSGDKSARELAQVWGETAEWLRQRFNKAGGAIGKLDKWGLPQQHDARALLNAGRSEWIVAIKPKLDVARMKHPLTGKAIMAEELDDILNDVWTSVVSDGWNKREASRQTLGKGALANQRAEHRFLVFKDAETWLSYQKDFGGGSDPFAAMMGHVSLMARDIAAMEILGPNANATVEWLKQINLKEAAAAASGKGNRIPGKNPLQRAEKINNRLDNVWASMRGALSTPTYSTFGLVMADMRNFITSSVLGGAALSAIGDVSTSTVTRAFSGINASRSVSDLVNAMLPATRREAVAAGLILDNAVNAFQAQARYIGTLQGSKWSEYLADRTLALSGLTPWTQSARHAFGLAFMREAAEQAGNSFDKLHPLFRAKFAQYGIDAKGWDIIRGAKQHSLGKDVNILRPNEISAQNEKLAQRYLAMILTETEYAVPSGSHRSRTALTGYARGGTVPEEILLSFAQFKSFAAVFALIYGHRSARLLMDRNTRKLGVGYVAALAIGSTLMGALSLQLKQVAAGRDPRDMLDKEFIGAAFLQGGGFGLYGDFLFSDLNRYGGGFPMAVAGPVAERVGSFTNLTIGNAIQLANGDKTNFGRELVGFARGNIPGGNIWYGRLAFERLFLDNLQYGLDPEASAAFRRKQQFWQREFGQGFWWKPGQMTPERAPDVGAALGN